MDETIERGPEPSRPPSRWGLVAAVLVSLGLGGAALAQLAGGVSESASDPPPAAGESARPTPTAASTEPPAPTTLATPAVIVPTTVPASRRHRAPWWGLPVGAPPRIGYADRGLVHVRTRTFRLGRLEHVVTLASSQRGPVVLVQETAGSSRLEQLRSNGTRLFLDTFDGVERFPAGVVIDPAGLRVAYGVSVVVDGSAHYRLVARDLATGDRVASVRTRLPPSVEDWTTAGIVVNWAVDPGGPPLLWDPVHGQLVSITPPADGEQGPFLLASAPDRAEWVVTLPDSGCTLQMSSPGQAATNRFCRFDLYAPGAWSPAGDNVVAKTRRGVRVLEVRTGATRRLPIPRRGFVRELAWEDPRTVLVVLDGQGSSSAVLRCRVGGQCERARLAQPGSSLLTLSR